ncbi:PhoH-like ATPase [Desulfacinum hydrothermale DSM 13146]|uniref:PhoH-like ATPase n=1 Tax=Desulfacinum hydrothermale DSM 13146 TaxID=1121390 RepID=A0A1W1XJI1_9BACT|nr:PhoH family protein [Desulfacinum hydrothermale]SMC23658.1 PhoH-like ATPase [Desulfacinum hydrothermale DSM 13146]
MNDQSIYVLDTNVLLHDPNALFSFPNARLIIPLAVIEEIDDQKKRQNEVGRNARLVSRWLDELRSQGPLSRGVSLANGGSLRIELNHMDNSFLPPALAPHKYDNRILALTQSLTGQESSRVVLVTKDLNLRIKADVLGIATRDYDSDRVNYSELYDGYRTLSVSGSEIDRLFREHQLPIPAGVHLFPNEFAVLTNRITPSQSALARHRDGTLTPLRFAGATVWGISARNKEQRLAMELVLDDTIRVVTLVGQAGTGKTLLALAAGLEKVVEQHAFHRLLITRPVVPVGDDLGYLPGSREEKLRPWMQPIHDNLELLFQDADDPSEPIDHLHQRGVLQMETFTYIRGRSIPNQFILCDEAQNLTPSMVKTLITRVGKGTKIVFTGDPDQIDHPYLDAGSNGLTYLVERLKSESLAGHVTLRKGERSRVAEMGAAVL